MIAQDMGDGVDVHVKLRSAQDLAPARLHGNPQDGYYVELEAPQFGIAAGQACVCYQGTRIIGGGWISGSAQSKKAMAA